MIITLCGSARFEDEFKEWNKRLTLAGHVVFSLASFPSDNGYVKQWYTDEQKMVLDRVHKMKIEASNGILVLDIGGYIGDSTRSEIFHAYALKKFVFALESKKFETEYGSVHAQDLDYLLDKLHIDIVSAL